VPASQFYGYQALQSHPCAVVELDYAILPAIDESNIDQWLTEFCGIKAETLPALAQLPQASNNRQANFVFARALALYGSWLDFVGMPCVSAGKVARVSPVDGQDGKLRVLIAFAVLDSMPVAMFARYLRVALELVRDRFSQKPDAGKAEELLKQVSDSVIDEMKQQIPFSYGGDSIIHEMARQDVPYRHLGLGIMRIGWGSRSRLIKVSNSDADSQIGKEICGMKHRTSQILCGAGLPGVENYLASSVDEALAIAKAIGWPVVVKPPHRERSEGVTTLIGTEAELRAAYDLASEYDQRVVVERHQPGRCYRIYVVGGKMIYAVRRLPQRVTGDGKQTIAELVEEANIKAFVFPPWKRYAPCALNEVAQQTLARQELAFDSVPAEGQHADLRSIDSHDFGGNVENVMDEIHPDNVDLAIRATKLIGMSICGVDLMSTDISKPWHQNGAVINEMNFGPAFRSSKREEQAAQVVSAFIEGDGRIPVHLVTGAGDILAASRKLKASLGKEGAGLHIVTPDHCEDANGQDVHLPAGTLFERSLALTLQPDVDGFIMAGVWPDLFKGGFAVDKLQSVAAANCDEDTATKLFEAIRSQVVVETCQRLT